MNNHFIVIAEAGDFIGEQKLIAQHLRGEMKGAQWHMEDGSVWDIVVTGVGAINVLKTLADLPRNAQIINIGYAGSANYEIGSVVCVTEAKLNHPCVSYPEPRLLLKKVPEAYLQSPSECLSSVCYSNTDFVLQSEYRDCVFDMELAYIAAMGFEHLVSLKIVSDNLSLHTYREVAAGVE
jgi:nucleoside phosphorylase